MSGIGTPNKILSAEDTCNVCGGDKLHEEVKLHRFAKHAHQKQQSSTTTVHTMLLIRVILVVATLLMIIG